VLAQAELSGLRPIIVGGTGLYFKALLEGLSPVAPIALTIRRYWRQRAQEQGAVALHAELARKDPTMAGRLKPTDRQRVTRALEVLDATGESLSTWQGLPGKGLLAEAECARVQVTMDRTELYGRCNARFDRMMGCGALDEVRALTALGLDDSLPAMRALGVAPLAAALAGQIPLPEAVERAKAETRQYAKRQLTWLRRNMNAWIPIDTKENFERSASNITFIDC
jgi:tRNA dimethylallyltransferase